MTSRLKLGVLRSPTYSVKWSVIFWRQVKNPSKRRIKAPLLIVQLPKSAEVQLIVNERANWQNIIVLQCCKEINSLWEEKEVIKQVLSVCMQSQVQQQSVCVYMK